MDRNEFLIKLSESKRTNFGRVDFAKQPEEQKIFSAVWELETQVNNGGFAQFFFNSDSDVIDFAPRALKIIGANRCRSIVAAAIATISPLPKTQDGRSKALAALSGKENEKLEELDSKFFEYPDNLTDLLFAYVAKHPKAFGSVPKGLA